MKKRILTFLCVVTLYFGVSAQTNLTYSLTRPIGGGNLNLVEFNMSLGTETIVKTYLPSELNDYNPEATAFDNQNNHFITVGDFGGSDSLIAINVSNGNIDFKYQSSSDEIFALEQNGSKTYSLTRPIGGGNLNLVEFNMSLGTETIVKTYLPSELNDYNPEATAFDNQNNHFITVGDFGGSDSLIAINVSNGNIDFKYQSSSDEIFALEQNGSKTYSLTRPIGGGNLNLVEFDMSLGTETIVKTYLPSELNDYNPEATAFDNQNNHFITVGDFGGSDSLIAINVSNGNIDFKYQSSSDEIFTIEVNGITTVDITEISVTNENILIYPNPCHNLIIIDADRKVENVKILDISGKIILSEPEENSIIDLSFLPIGAYWVSLTQANKSFTKMILKQ